MPSAVNSILDFYARYGDAISLIRDVLFIIGIPPALYFAIRTLARLHFNRKTGNIRRDLQLRSDIEPELSKYVLENAKTEDVGVRFVHWKHYPNILRSNDAFKHNVYVKYYNDDNDMPFPASWLDNVGVFFQEHLWYTSTSCYVDEDRFFFFSREGEQHPGFTEFQDGRLILCLPYTNIVAFDFREYIEYEPVFYIRYPYTSARKLYCNDMKVIGRDDKDHRYVHLEQRKWLKKYSWYGYMFIRMKVGYLPWRTNPSGTD